MMTRTTTTTTTIRGFDPKSSMTSYADRGCCGPRGDDAKADLSACVSAATIVSERKFDDFKVVATVDGCDYFAYKIYSCEKGFDPKSFMTSYADRGCCGPRG